MVWYIRLACIHMLVAMQIESMKWSFHEGRGGHGPPWPQGSSASGCRCCLTWWSSTRLGAGMGGWRRVMTSRTASCDVYRCVRLFHFHCFRTLNFYFSCHEQWFVIIKPLEGDWDLKLAFAWVLMHMFNPLCEFQVTYRALTQQLTTGWYFTVA
jgi:hypothetical protein